MLELAAFERLTESVTGNADKLRGSLFGSSPSCNCRVVEVEGSVVGYCLTFSTYSTFRTQPGIWLEDLYVTPAYRGKGLGKAMLNDLIDRARSSGVGRIEWSVLDWNESAIDFYKKLGADVLPDWRICRISVGL